ncbi:restriction endonuclease, SacI family [Bordetella sp. FB-8]|uniref:restriction endonuclease, SacI family n=1 Tax=Bordetella sp. FB-8 TaxID=1159870 RepID=UPI0018CAC260|nr:restriction endonuclease, SacI family [Bordetella sp. FB-8]
MNSFERIANRILNELWIELEAIPIDQLPVGDVSDDAYTVFENPEIGWKYSVIIQVAGKAADFSLDALCLQKGDGLLPGLWEPREFAKRVVVPWHKAIGAPLGTSGDPYVNNIFRKPRFDEAMRAARRRPVMFDTVKRLLDRVQASGSPDEVRDRLKFILAQLRRYMSGKSFEYPIPQRVGLGDTLACLLGYLDTASGGARLQAVAQGLVMALQAKGIAYERIISRHVNAADAASNSAGDVECFVGDRNIFTIEVKDRELTIAELESSIEKARLSSVQELLFFVHRRHREEPCAEEDKAQIERIVARQFALGLNIYIEKAEHFLRLTCTLLGEDGRKSFLHFVGLALGAQGADPQHRWAWSQEVRGIGAEA